MAKERQRQYQYHEVTDRVGKHKARKERAQTGRKHEERPGSLGMVVTTSPTCSRYRMVVFPAPSSPRISILISLAPHRLAKRREKKLPGGREGVRGWCGERGKQEKAIAWGGLDGACDCVK